MTILTDPQIKWDKETDRDKLVLITNRESHMAF